MLRRQVPVGLTIDYDRDESFEPPPAPKRRKRPEVGRAERLAAFSAAAALAASNPDSAAVCIQSAARGCRVRADVKRLRPGSASSTSSVPSGAEEVPEEIEEALAVCKAADPLVETLASLTLDNPVDSALESSAELDDYQVPRSVNSCAICLTPMEGRQRRPATPGQTTAHRRLSGSLALGRSLIPVPAALTVATLECGHRYHRKCLLAWCRQCPPGRCPECRKEVQVRRKTATTSRANVHY